MLNEMLLQIASLLNTDFSLWEWMMIFAIVAVIAFVIMSNRILRKITGTILYIIGIVVFGCCLVVAITDIDLAPVGDSLQNYNIIVKLWPASLVVLLLAWLVTPWKKKKLVIYFTRTPVKRQWR